MGTARLKDSYRLVIKPIKKRTAFSPQGEEQSFLLFPDSKALRQREALVRLLRAQ